MGLFNKTEDNGATTSSPVAPSYNYLSLINNKAQVIKSNATQVTIKDDKLSFNLMNSIPAGGRLTDYNISLFALQNGVNKLLKAGLSVNTTNYDVAGTGNLFLKGNLLYEKDGETFESSLNHNIVDGTSIVMDTKTPTPIINSDEEFINYLINELELLKARVSSLEKGE